MKTINISILLLIFITSISISPVFAEIEHGINYDKELLPINPDGSKNIRLETFNDRILVNGVYKAYHYTNFENYMQIETLQGSVILDKTTCAFDFYNKGFINGSPLFTDSIVPKMANNGTEIWNIVSEINDAICEAYYDETNVSLVAKKYVVGIGLLEYKYIFNNGEWKTELKVINLSSLTNKKFGFTQTINLNRDSIFWGNTTKNLDNFNQQTFNRNFLENNESKVLNLLNGFFFDLDLAFPMLESVYVEDNGQDKSKISFNYYHNAKILLPNETLIIDPTILQNSGGTNRGIGAGAGNEIFRGQHVTATSALNGLTITEASFWLKIAVGAPAGTVTIGVYDSGFNLVHTFTTFNANTVGAGYTKFTGTTGSYELQTGDRIGAHFSAGTGADFLYVDTAGADVYNGTNTVLSGYIAGYADESGNDARFELIWNFGIPAPPTNLSCTGLPYAYSCSWTAINATYVDGYYLSKSANNSTWTGITSVANVTSATYSGFGINSSNYIRVNATSVGLNSTSSNVVYTTTDNYPDSPSISLAGLNTTAIRITRSAGASNGGDTIVKYDLRCEKNNAGGWLNTVTNGTITSIYDYGSLASGDSLTCQWRDRNGVGYSSWSANGTGRSYVHTTGTLSYAYTNVGDVFLLNGTLSSIRASPTPQTGTQIEVIDNGTVTATKAVSNSLLSGSSASITFIPILVNDDLVHQIKLRLTATSYSGTVKINSTTQNLVREYAPIYEPAETPSQGNIYHIESRSGSNVLMSANRELNLATFQMECAFYTSTQARLGEDGVPVWVNRTGVYFYDISVAMDASQTTYFKCYNDPLLYQGWIPANGTAILGGFAGLDDMLGNWMGVPIASLFILFIASMATKTNSHITIIAIMVAIGIMGGIGFFTMDTGLWALILIIGTLALVGSKLGFD